jgi:hypothetical protein
VAHETECSIGVSRWRGHADPVAGWSGAATAQVDCETIPPGPARTDCYIGLSRIARQNSEIAASVAQQQTDRAIYRSVTGSSPKKKMYRTLR